MSLPALSPPSHHIYNPQRNRHYAPQTPSPLRTSRNANLMPPPTPVNTLKATSGSKTSSPFLMTPTSISSTSSTFDPSSTSRSSPISPSVLPFQFQNRSRSQSPQASLAKSNAAAKTRRSSLFLDKVRQKREDSRFETRGEQVLRMDFVRERRAWEERLKRRAPSFEVEADDTIMDEVDQDMGVRDDAIKDENAIPSPTEDREIEELLSYLETDGSHSVDGHATGVFSYRGSAGHPAMLDTTSDDEYYDQLFMEVMADADGFSQASTRERERWRDANQDQESSMDLS